MDYSKFEREGLKNHKKLRDLPPCTFGKPIIEYFNRADVRKDLHISEKADSWDLCNSTVGKLY